MDLLKKIAKNKNIKRPVIYGLSGLFLNKEEKDFFKKSGPIGFILFARNISDKIQLRNLTDSLRDLMQGEVLILIDQEGGRVARLNVNNNIDNNGWQKYPAAAHFAKIYESGNKIEAESACFKNYKQIAEDLKEVGINVNCAPVLDILAPATHKIIGDRAFGENAIQVCDLALQACSGLVSGDVYPVIKHIPGHGRATLDSHEALPIVDSDLEDLNNSDFIPFKHLKDVKFAMTAHILYTKIDAQLPITLSKKGIDFIRNEIGFKNILMSDDLSMKALGGAFGYRTKKSLEAGCDLVLHCNGRMEEMLEIHENLPLINDDLIQKLIK